MKRTLYLLALGVFGIGTTEFGVVGILPQIAVQFGVTINQAGWLLSAFAGVIAVGAPFITVAFAGRSRRQALMAVLALFMVGNGLSAVAVNFPMLLVARVLPALGHPVFWSVALSVAATSVRQEEAPKAVGIVFGGFTIASVLGVPLCTWVADRYGWQAAFILSGGVNAVSLLGLWLWLPEIPAREGVSYSWDIIRKPALWRQLSLAVLMIAAMYASYGYLAAYLDKVTGMDGRDISIMLLLFGVAGVGGNWLAGKLLSKSIHLTTISFIVMLALVHIGIYLAGASYGLMIVVIIIWGFIHTGGFLISNINVTSVAKESPELANAIFTSAGNLAVTIGATMGGAVIAGASVRNVIWASMALLALAAIVWTWSAKKIILS
ncbi:putative MFS family arabinose efflux permease [Chitinophaga polysaccharea]|uniref:Putative MFS family arabinose efflux permease n=1 Tax=Chitinophaga polysaccharea TaxID=1293035 RepID=A0A561PCB5_9BACT|nr:MFS transporter [Chitinophaga polysaccharea]TWF35765.1 putative MFS family arabinose efflux permease [Chitinophaga polysaccharea]